MAHDPASMDASCCALIIIGGNGGENVKDRATAGADKMLMVFCHSVESGNGRTVDQHFAKLPFFY